MPTVTASRFAPSLAPRFAPSLDASNFPLGLLQFSRGNSKLPSSTLILSLPAGHTCPGALLCQSRADRNSGRITDGPKTRFRCYAASEETRPTVRAARWLNLERIQQQPASQLSRLLITSVAVARVSGSPWVERVRWFGAGDCFSPALRDALIATAEEIPDLTFYLYSKNLPLFLDRTLPYNLFLTASWGGRYDHLIEAGHFPRNSRVVNTAAEAMALKLPIDFSDALAYDPVPQAFTHLVHGTQPKGSAAGAALQSRKVSGQFAGYGANFTPTVDVIGV
jgi:hypothetical protein